MGFFPYFKGFLKKNAPLKEHLEALKPENHKKLQ